MGCCWVSKWLVNRHPAAQEHLILINVLGTVVVVVVAFAVIVQVRGRSFCQASDKSFRIQKGSSAAPFEANES